MNCQSVQEQLLTDPYCLDLAAHLHVAECQECAEAVEQALVFEKLLWDALVIDTPLASGISGVPRYALRFAS